MQKIAFIPLSRLQS